MKYVAIGVALYFAVVAVVAYALARRKNCPSCRYPLHKCDCPSK